MLAPSPPVEDIKDAVVISTNPGPRKTLLAQDEVQGGRPSVAAIETDERSAAGGHHDTTYGGGVAVGPGASLGGDGPVDTRKSVGTTNSGVPSSGYCGGTRAAAPSIPEQSPRPTLLTKSGANLELMTKETGEAVRQMLVVWERGGRGG